MYSYVTVQEPVTAGHQQLWTTDILNYFCRNSPWIADTHFTMLEQKQTCSLS